MYASLEASAARMFTKEKYINVNGSLTGEKKELLGHDLFNDFAFNALMQSFHKVRF